MSRDNVELVRRAYEAWNAGEFEEAAEVLSPEIEWRLPPNVPDTDTWSPGRRLNRASKHSWSPGQNFARWSGIYAALGIRGSRWSSANAAPPYGSRARRSGRVDLAGRQGGQGRDAQRYARPPRRGGQPRIAFFGEAPPRSETSPRSGERLLVPRRAARRASRPAEGDEAFARRTPAYADDRRHFFALAGTLASDGEPL